MRIHLSDSPFYLRPIYEIATHLGVTVDKPCVGNIFRLLAPLNEEFSIYGENSHLTDMQDVNEQIRFLGVSEIRRKLQRIALEISRVSSGIDLELVVPKDTIVTQELLFVLRTVSKLELDFLYKISFSDTDQAVSVPFSRGEQSLLHLLDEKHKRFADERLAKCAEVMKSGDYYTAINILNTMVLSDQEISKIRAEIECRLGACNEFLGRTFNAEAHWRYALEHGDHNQQFRASYSISMLHLRHHSPSHRKKELARELLQSSFRSLAGPSSMSDNEVSLRRTFNRNGYALLLFLDGDIANAEALLRQGLVDLSEIFTRQSIFHSSVISYNLYQCLLAKGQIFNAALQLKELLASDPMFLPYHEYLIQFSLDQEDFEEAELACRSAIKVDADHYKFRRLLGIAHLQQDKLSEAYESFQASLQLNPNDVASKTFLTSIMLSFGEYNQVLRIIEDTDLSQANDASREILMANIQAAKYENGRKR